MAQIPLQYKEKFLIPTLKELRISPARFNAIYVKHVLISLGYKPKMEKKGGYQIVVPESQMKVSVTAGVTIKTKKGKK
jgi:hypothetical protein